MNYNTEDVMRCIEVFSTDEQSSYNLSFPNSESDFDFETRMYWIDGHQSLEAELDYDTNEICIKGKDPIVLLRSYVLNETNLATAFLCQTPNLPNQLITPQNGTLIDSTDVRGWGSELTYSNQAVLSVSDTECQINSMASTPTKPKNESEQWVWNTNYRSSSLMPEIRDNDSIMLVFSDTDTGSICSESMYPVPDTTFSIEYGPELMF